MTPLTTLLLRADLAVTGACLVLGIAAALVGGSLEGFGSGAGGLGGFPTLVLLLLGVAGVATGLASLLRRGDRASALVALAGPMLVFLSFFQGAHLLDPCASGRWDLRSRVGDTRLCGAWGGGLEIHERFHLLMHAAPGFAAAVVVVAVARRLDPAAPDHIARAEPA